MPTQEPLVSIVIPVLGDMAALQRLTAQLNSSPISHDWPIIVVEGTRESPEYFERSGQSDIAKWCETQGFRHGISQASRGEQISNGIAWASTDWVWVLHADSEPSPESLVSMQQISAAGRPRWGRFNVEIPGLAMVAVFMNLRSRLTKICTGDQGMFFMRELLVQVGGFPRQPLMEDIEVSRRLKRRAAYAFTALPAPIKTSNRRWRQRGAVRTIVSMWGYRLRYFFGTSAHTLYRRYYGDRCD